MAASSLCGQVKETVEHFDSVAGTASALVPGYTLLGPGQCQDFYETTKASWRSIQNVTRICRFVSRVLPKARSKLKCKGNTFENFRVRFWRLSVLLQDSSSEACAKTCSSDPRCRFFSVNLGVACNKFNATLTWTLAGLLHAHASLQSSRINKVLVLDASCFFSIF